MTESLKLLSPVRLGPYELKNRMVMAPLTRMRAGEGNVPGPLNAEYYRQRASAGLIVSEATQVSPQGQGYPNTPGIHSPEQVAGWKAVTDAVHGQGGRMFLQLWHVGRISHSDYHGGALPVAPSAIAPREGKVFTPTGEKDYEVPRALETAELPEIVAQYVRGAENAIAAGFDGVEVHGANGYLLDQFLHDDTNHRSDRYGGSIENRARLLLEVVDAVASVWGRDRVGVRLSPSGTFGDVHDSDPAALFEFVVRALGDRGLAYLHLVEPRVQGNVTIENPETNLGSAHFRPLYPGAIVAAGGYSRETGEAALQDGTADLVAYGRWFIANPDLPERFARNAELNPYDRDTFYGGDARGYTDYPFLAEDVA